MEISLLPLYSLPFLLNLSLSLVNWLFISTNSCAYYPADQNAFSDSFLTLQKWSGKIMICSLDTYVFMSFSVCCSLSLSLSIFYFFLPWTPVTFDTRYNWQQVWSLFKDSTEIILKAQNTLSDLCLNSPWQMIFNNRPIKKSANLCLVCTNFWSII